MCYINGSFGWSCDEHRVISLIASQLIRRKTRKYINDHLPRIPGSKMNDYESALVRAACWADSVVDVYPWSAELHFVHTPYRNCQPYNERRDCGFGGTGRCLVTAIANYSMRAGDFNQPSHQITEALKFLVHFMGDIHQPLHAGFAQDAGGTGIPLSPRGISLHVLWDSYLLDYWNVERKKWFKIGFSLGEEVRRYRLPKSPIHMRDSERFASRIVSEITSKITCEFSYSDERYLERWDTVSQKYMKSRSNIAINLLKEAGVNLATMLDAIAVSFSE
jgi:hypothetical protein